MRDAQYLRAQAELYLEMGRQIGDRVAADSLRAEAERHHAEATEIEIAVKSAVIKAAAERD
jgi:hypothetical protein